MASKSDYELSRKQYRKLHHRYKKLCGKDCFCGKPRYDRNKFKRDTNRIIKENMDEPS